MSKLNVAPVISYLQFQFTYCYLLATYYITLYYSDYKCLLLLCRNNQNTTGVTVTAWLSSFYNEHMALNKLNYFHNFDFVNCT